MGSFVLGFLLMLTTPRLSAATTIIGVGLAVAASLTKETGLIAPALGLVACGAMHASRQRWVVALVAVAAVALALAVRFAFVPLGSAVPQLSRYDVKELLVRPFATLAVPLRVSEVAALPWLPVALVTAVIVSLVVAGLRWNRGSGEFHRVLFGAAFVLLRSSSTRTF